MARSESSKSSHRSFGPLLAVVLGLVACSPGEVQDRSETLAVGLISPVESTLFRSGQQTVEGAELAVQEINAAGGVTVDGTPQKLRLVVESSDGRPETAVSKAFKLIGSDRVVALVGLPVSDAAVAAAQVAEDHGLPTISTTATHPDLTRGRDYVFRMIFEDSFQARRLAEFAWYELEARRVALLVDPGSVYSRSFADEFRRLFVESGGAVLTLDRLTVDLADASQEIHRIQEADVDVLVLPMYPPLVANFMPQVRAAGIFVPALGGDSWSLASDEERQGWSPAFFSDVWTPELPSDPQRQFVDAYRASYGSVPTYSAALAYDAVLLLARAIEQQGNAGPEAIRDGLRTLEDFEGVTGKVRFQGGGDPRRTVLIRRVDADGSAHFHRRFEP